MTSFRMLSLTTSCLFLLSLFTFTAAQQSFTFPTGGSTITAGSKTTVTWNNLISGDSTVSITLCHNAGADCTQLDSSVDNNGSWDWTPSTSISSATDYFFVMNSGRTVVATSSAFTISSSNGSSSSSTSVASTAGSSASSTSNSAATTTSPSSSTSSSNSLRPVTVTVTNANGSQQTVVANTGTSSSSSSGPSAATLGGAIGGSLGGVALLLGLLLYFIGRKKAWFGSKKAAKDAKKDDDVEAGIVSEKKGMYDPVEAPSDNGVVELPASQVPVEIMDARTGDDVVEIDGREILPSPPHSPTFVTPEAAGTGFTEFSKPDQNGPGIEISSPEGNRTSMDGSTVRGYERSDDELFLPKMDFEEHAKDKPLINNEIATEPGALKDVDAERANEMPPIEEANRDPKIAREGYRHMESRN